MFIYIPLFTIDLFIIYFHLFIFPPGLYDNTLTAGIVMCPSFSSKI